MGWRVHDIDRMDQAQTRPLWELGKVVDELGRPWSHYWAWESARLAFEAVPRAHSQDLTAVHDDGELVGTARLTMPLLDNLHRAEVEIAVLPGRRRLGIGSALLDRAVADALGAGRTVMGAEVMTPAEGPPSDGVRFAEARGFTTGIVDEMKAVDLMATEPTWRALGESAAPYHEDYRLVSWLDVVPEELMAGYCALQEAFNEEAPTGELELERERWDTERVRAKEESFRERGRHEACTAAVHRDGTVAGLTEVMLSAHMPHLGFQGGTLVLPEHRGHRLGLAMKVVNHQQIRREFSTCRQLITGNAGVNAPMNAVNDMLGFTVQEHCLEMQRRLQP